MGTNNKYGCTSCDLVAIIDCPEIWCNDCGEFTGRKAIDETADFDDEGVKSWDEEPACPNCDSATEDEWFWNSPCPKCGKGVQSVYPESLRKSGHATYTCDTCSYSAEYAFKVLSDPTRKKSTYRCGACREIFIFTRRPIFPAKNEANARREVLGKAMCSKCDSENVRSWTGMKPCPRCGGAVQDFGVVEFYDGPEMFD